MGHMMSTMVLSRKQSVFGASSLPSGAGVPEPLDRSKFEDNEDIVVMETKLKILEILQVLGRWVGGPRAGPLVFRITGFCLKVLLGPAALTLLGDLSPTQTCCSL